MASITAPDPAATAPAAPLPPETPSASVLGRRRISGGPPTWLLTLAVGALVAAVCFVAEGATGLGSMTAVEIVLLLLGGGALAAALLLAPDGTRPHGGITVAVFAALALLTALSISWAINPADAWLEANRTIAYLAAFAGIAAVARLAPRRWPALLGGLLLGCAIVCGAAVLAKVAPGWLDETETFARLRAPFGYWNAIGLIGALALPACLWLGSRRYGHPLLNALAYPILSLALCTSLLAYSRGSLLAAGISAAFWFALVPLRLRGATVLLVGGAGGVALALWAFSQDALNTDRVELAERSAAGLELGVLLVAVLGLIYAAGLAAGFIADAKPLGPVARRRAGIALLVGLALTPVAAAGGLATTERGLGGSLADAWDTVTDPKAATPRNEPGRLTTVGSVRARYWNEAGRMFGDKTLAGLGSGGYATARPRYRQDTLDVRHAHGYIPQTIADLGLLGLLLSLGLLAAWALAARTTIRASGGAERVGLLTLTAIVLGFGVHSLIDWTWAIPGTALVGLLAAGWIAGRGPEAPGGLTALRRPAWRDRRRQVLAGGVALLALLAAWTAYQPLRSDGRTEDALTALAKNDLAKAREEARAARDINPLALEPHFALAAVERRAGDLAKAESALEDAVALQPSNYLPWLRLAEFQLWFAKRPEDADKTVRSAIYLNPLSYEVNQRFLDVHRTLNGAT